eukprot:m.24632 g.24632  ORF g.24632 m.24632 type:complete len:520 (-) comp4039_c0_seq1:1041-2600(-)
MCLTAHGLSCHHGSRQRDGQRLGLATALGSEQLEGLEMLHVSLAKHIQLVRDVQPVELFGAPDGSATALRFQKSSLDGASGRVALQPSADNCVTALRGLLWPRLLGHIRIDIEGTLLANVAAPARALARAVALAVAAAARRLRQRPDLRVVDPVVEARAPVVEVHQVAGLLAGLRRHVQTATDNRGLVELSVLVHRADAAADRVLEEQLVLRRLCRDARVVLPLAALVGAPVAAAHTLRGADQVVVRLLHERDRLDGRQQRLDIRASHIDLHRLRHSLVRHNPGGRGRRIRQAVLLVLLGGAGRGAARLCPRSRTARPPRALVAALPLTIAIAGWRRLRLGHLLGLDLGVADDCGLGGGRGGSHHGRRRRGRLLLLNFPPRPPTARRRLHGNRRDDSFWDSVGDGVDRLGLGGGVCQLGLVLLEAREILLVSLGDAVDARRRKRLEAKLHVQALPQMLFIHRCRAALALHQGEQAEEIQILEREHWRPLDLNAFQLAVRCIVRLELALLHRIRGPIDCR